MARFREGTANYNNGTFNWGKTPSLNSTNERTDFGMKNPAFGPSALGGRAGEWSPGQKSLVTGEQLRSRASVPKRMPR